MRFKPFHFLVGAVVVVALLGAAGVVRASSLTSMQISAFLSFLSSFGVDQSTINSVSRALGSSVATSTAPSVAIDQGSLTAVAGNLTLTGSAQNMRVVMVKILDNRGAILGNSDGRPGWVTADGRWSTQMPYTPAGTYTLQLFGNGADEAASTIRLLGSATLIVSAN